MDSKHELSALTHALRRLHLALVNVARRDYEKEWGEVAPGELLQLLTKHPSFEWLRELSALMTGIDELIDQENIETEEIQAVYTQTKALMLQTGAAPSPFSQRYRDILQNEPLVVMEHAGVRQLLDLSYVG